MNDEKIEKKRAILFIPETGIYPYARALAVLGDALKKGGYDVFITHDTGQMLRSPIMSMYRLPVNANAKQKAKINKANEKMFRRVQRNYSFFSIELSDFTNQALLKEINNLVNVPYENLEKISYRGFAVGQIAQYDFVLESKFPYSPDLSWEWNELFKLYIKNTALTVAITNQICERYQPALLLTFNEYAQGQAVRHSAKTHNASRLAVTHPSHLNIDCSKFSVWSSTWGSWTYNHCKKWNNFKNVPIRQKDVVACWQDVIFRLYRLGTHVFSSSKKNNPALIFNNLKLSSNRKTVVVYTSGQEERTTTKLAMRIWNENTYITDAFCNHIEWLSMLRDYAANRKDIQIVVRVHPREGARQFGFDSLHLKQLKAKFTENTSNFIVIWPNDPVSSYDLMELADVCLVSWSSMGQEAARLGIPVLSCVGSMSYQDDDFIQVATTPEEYKRKLDSVLQMEFTWEHLLKSARFYHWRTFVVSLNLGGTVPLDIQDDTIWPEAPPAMVGTINEILSGKQDLISYNIKEWQTSLPVNAASLETEAMRQGIRYFLDNIFYPPFAFGKRINLLIRIYRKVRKILLHLVNKKVFVSNSPKLSFHDYRLEFSSNPSKIEEFIHKTKQNNDLRILLGDGLYAILIHKGKIMCRMSPLAVRLAKLHDFSIKFSL